MGAPLLDDGRLVGVIHVDSVAQRCFTEEESQLLQELAERIARAIARAQLYEHMQQSRTQAERKVAALQEATERMNEFLSVASHELKTPVTSMKVSVQLTMRAARSLTALALPETSAAMLKRALKLLARTDQQATKLGRLIDDLLDVTRLQTGIATIRLAPADLGAIVREAIDQQQLAWPGREISLDLQSRPDTLPALVLDADRVSQVVTNYLTNALKYSADDAPVTVTITFRGRDDPDQDRDHVRVAVCDRGPGLSTEQQVQLWQLYHRVPGIVQQSGSGAGLGIGLYVCKAIVEQHGGRVGVESAPGEGSTFWFTLPQPDVHPDVHPADSTEEYRRSNERMSDTHTPSAHTSATQDPERASPDRSPASGRHPGRRTPLGSLVLVMGLPGSGKTTLASQVAFTAARAGKRVLILTALSEPTGKLIEHLRSFAFFDQDFIGGPVQFLSLQASLGGGLQAMAKVVMDEARRIKADLILLDGFRGMRSVDADPQVAREFLYDLGTSLGALKTTTVVTSETDPRDPAFFPETTTADVILGLHYNLLGVRQQRGIEVIKARGAAPLPGLHTLTLGAEGVHVYPQLRSAS